MMKELERLPYEYHESTDSIDDSKGFTVFGISQLGSEETILVLQSINLFPEAVELIRQCKPELGVTRKAHELYNRINEFLTKLEEDEDK